MVTSGHMEVLLLRAAAKGWSYPQKLSRCYLLLMGAVMPIFLDRHDLTGLTAADVAEAHRKDLEIQKQYGVRFLTYWFDDT